MASLADRIADLFERREERVEGTYAAFKAVLGLILWTAVLCFLFWEAISGIRWMWNHI